MVPKPQNLVATPFLRPGLLGRGVLPKGGINRALHP